MSGRSIAISDAGRRALRDAVTKRRTDRGWLQSQVAERGGFSVDRLQAVESGTIREAIRAATLERLDRGLLWTPGSSLDIILRRADDGIELVAGKNWSVASAVKASCRCGWSCAEHDEEKVATFCVRSHAANCSVGLGVESHDAAVRDHLLDVWGDRP